MSHQRLFLLDDDFHTYFFSHIRFVVTLNSFDGFFGEDLCVGSGEKIELKDAT